MKLALLLLLPTPLLAAGTKHFTLSATFEPPTKAGGQGAIAVSFVPQDPDVKVNQEPGPRIKLDPAQQVLVDKQPPAPTHVTPYDPDTARYLDPAQPVRFPVALAAGARKGRQTLRANVTYFYCSKREGWCRKGTDEVELPVTVP
jgi:hypothetical protein